MLLKFTKSSGGIGSSSNGLSSTTTIIGRGTGMRMTMATTSTMTPRIHRKGFRTPSKRHPGKALPGKLHSISRIGPGKIPPGKRIPQRPHPPPCDNSNDSGFGFDQHVEVQHNNNNNNNSNANNNNITNNDSSSNHHQQPQQQQQLIRAVPSSRLTTAITSIDDGHYDGSNDFGSTDDDHDEFYQDRVTAAVAAPSAEVTQATTAAYRCVNRIKRKKLESHVELDNDDACSEDAFIHKIATASSASQNNNNNNVNLYLTHAAVVPTLPSPTPTPTPLSSLHITNNTKLIASGTRTTRVAHKRQPAASLNNVTSSSNGRVQLEIISQPEQQHRARYQTEGSRGAVKDRSGNGFPIVRLVGYNKPALLQVFIGTDIGRVAPHMFYQACKVAGKNSTQCNEKKFEGTMIIEIDFKPETEMTITCDCVGILKERNVDVEHRFPDHLAQKNKKKSTRCRMVFRTQLTHDDGSVETLQVCSNPIICTQPPGVPEICKKSLNSCPVDGGLELFIIGKNFLKDTHVLFQETYVDNDGGGGNDTELTTSQHQQIGTTWEQSVLPDKEYLQQTHLICTVPPYIHQNLLKPVTVQLSIISSGKRSESHSFVYTPKGSYTTLSAASTLSTLHGTLSDQQQQDSSFMDTSTSSTTSSPAINSSVVGVGIGIGCPSTNGSNTNGSLWTTTGGGGGAIETKHEIDSDMMPPPITTQIPMVVRRPSLTNAMITDQLVQISGLKTEIMDENSQNSIVVVDAMKSDPMDQFPTVQQQQQQQQQTTATSVIVDGSRHNPLKEAAAIQEYHQRLRKHSIDMLDIRNMTILNDQANSMHSFSGVAVANNQMDAAVAAAAVELAVKNEQIANEILSAAVVQQDQQTAVDKFLSSLDVTMAGSELAKPLVVTSTTTQQEQLEQQQQTMFGVSPTSDLGGGVSASHVLFPTNAASIDQTITDILQHAAATANSPVAIHDQVGVLVRSSSISSNSSSSSSSSLSPSSASSPASMPSSPGIAVKSINSPITHDIILNSEPAATINSVNMQQMMQGGAANCDSSSSEHISTEIILNPAVTPSSILCSADGTSNTVVVPSLMGPHPHQVTMANSILNGIALQSQPIQQDAVAALGLGNMILSSSAANGTIGTSVHQQCQQQPQQQATIVQEPEVTAASTAVSNMIIKAAADFISNQENGGSHHHHNQQVQQHQLSPAESMLMSLNTTVSPIDATTQSQLLAESATIRGAATGGLLSNVAVAATTAAQMCNRPQQFLARHHSMIDTRPAQDVTAAAVAAAAAADPLVNLLLTHAEVQVQKAQAAAAAAGVDVNSVTAQFPMGITPSTQQESLMVALAESALQKSVTTNGVVTQQQQQQPPQQQVINEILQPNVVAAPTVVPLPPPIPQELTTMSDQDLISYINPSTFDQI